MFCQVFGNKEKKRESQGSYFTQQTLRHQGHFFIDVGSLEMNCTQLSTVFQRCITERPRCRRVHIFCSLEKQKLHLWSIGRVRVGDNAMTPLKGVQLEEDQSQCPPHRLSPFCNKLAGAQFHCEIGKCLGALLQTFRGPA